MSEEKCGTCEHFFKVYHDLAFVPFNDPVRNGKT